jgi:hypothetical protein
LGRHVEKQSRDLGSKGSLWILVVDLFKRISVSFAAHTYLVKRLELRSDFHMTFVMSIFGTIMLVLYVHFWFKHRLPLYSQESRNLDWWIMFFVWWEGKEIGSM